EALKALQRRVNSHLGELNKVMNPDSSSSLSFTTGDPKSSSGEEIPLPLPQYRKPIHRIAREQLQARRSDMEQKPDIFYAGVAVLGQDEKENRKVFRKIIKEYIAVNANRNRKQ